MANGLLLHNIGIYKMIARCLLFVPVDGEEMHARSHIQ